MPVLLNEPKSAPFDIKLDCAGIGMVFDINGRRTEDEAFSISLSSACNLTKDVPFHFSPRPKKKNIALNTMKSGKWGKEQVVSWDDTFNVNIDFQLRLIVTQNGFEVYDRRETVPRCIANLARRLEMDCNYLVFGGQGCTVTFVDRC
ncbi:uncharacterized protein [Littorina saxatilis]|uniref:uncharacterized protein n=1 Tax=Littorina saxatilis TaxID=31220 RepID=UPI0038B5A59A